MRRPRAAVVVRKREVHPSDWVHPKVVAIIVPVHEPKFDTLPPPRKRRNRNSK